MSRISRGTVSITIAVPAAAGTTTFLQKRIGANNLR
jgi:hypothetical protein